jgi:hypothetical protein
MRDYVRPVAPRGGRNSGTEPWLTGDKIARLSAGPY